MLNGEGGREGGREGGTKEGEQVGGARRKMGKGRDLIL